MRGVLLDIDGTLVDSNDAHARAWHDVLTEAGYQVTVDKLRRLIGMGSDKLLPRAVGVEKDSPTGKRLSERRKIVFRERYLPELKPTRGARALLERLRGDGYTLVVASSADGEELQALLDVIPAADLVQDVTSSSEVSGSKPEPDIVEAALKKVGASPSEAVMLGDTPYDVEAATRASVAIIVLRCGGWSDADLTGALVVYDDPANLLEHYADSPFSKSAGKAATNAADVTDLGA
ncbi:MAG TPA: HAD family hydrolase [Chloroflexota bacterium]|nr:HAD family hydrolase [Chloroflexota bacterium]